MLRVGLRIGLRASRCFHTGCTRLGDRFEAQDTYLARCFLWVFALLALGAAVGLVLMGPLIIYMVVTDPHPRTSPSDRWFLVGVLSFLLMPLVCLGAVGVGYILLRIWYMPPMYLSLTDAEAQWTETVKRLTEEEVERLAEEQSPI